ncbi:hypothetical protein YC2023_050252 [Brassica napus]
MQHNKRIKITKKVSNFKGQIHSLTFGFDFVEVSRRGEPWRERRGVVKEIKRETEASRRATEMTIQPLETPAYSVDDSSSVDSVARRSSPRRDHQMPSESSRRHERKREEVSVESEREG